jgi:hypothetical protein
MLYLIVPLAVLIGVIWALVVFPSFRVVALILVVLGVGAYFVASEKAAQEQKQQEAKKAQEEAQQRIEFETKQRDYCQAERKRWTIVPASQIEVRNPSLTQGQFYGVVNDEYTFAASAKNKSKFKVTALRFNITALDCPTQDARVTDCDIVGHSDGTFDADIPAGEVRQIKGKVTLRDVPKPRGMFSPRFAVNGVRAPIDGQTTRPPTIF